VRNLVSTRILKIADSDSAPKEGETAPSDLGFNEAYFQYFIFLGDFTFVVFPIEQEAILKKGFVLKFNSKWKFQESTALPMLGENTMRPTAVVLHNKDEGKRLFMLGGR
jgi:hypothetical protein